MSHDHAHGQGHDHALHHGHAHAVAERDAVAPTVLMSGAATRVAAVLGALALLWGAVAWALADLTT